MTKVVATIGPASDHRQTLEALLQAGMNVARLNLSHGTLDEHRARLDCIRAASLATGINVAVMVDTRGLEIRTGATPPIFHSVMLSAQAPGEPPQPGIPESSVA